MNILRKAVEFFAMRLSGGSSIRETGPVIGSDSGEGVGENAVLALSAAWACVNLVAGTVATLPCVIYRAGRDGRQIDRTHPLYRVLHDSPNYDQTAVDFWEYQSAALELRGNAYARVARRADGAVGGLYPVAPALMHVERERRSGALRYRWTEDGRHFDLSDRDVLHIRGFGGDPLGGRSTLESGRNVFGAARATDRAAASTFRNGLRPSGVMSFESWLSKENREIAETALAEKFAGAMNAGRPMILEGGTKWQQLTISPEDAQMLESRAFSVEEICRMFGVPPFMIGHTEKSTSWGTGLEQQTLAFQKFTLRRRLRRIEQAVSQQLLTPADRAAGVTVEFNVEGLLRGDSGARAAFYREMSGIGAMTINEIRAKENLPPVPGGDVPRMQMQNVPITQEAIAP